MKLHEVTDFNKEFEKAYGDIARTNPVAKHSRKFNKATVQKDKKKAAKKEGQRKQKHKGNSDVYT